MLKQGNTKLGPGIYTWSLPSGIKEICIGASEVCLLLCYAMQGFFRLRNVKESHVTNYKKSLQEDFATTMIIAIRYFMASIVRVHVGGDFYNAAYVRKWQEIIKRNPNVKFYAYTRSWADPETLEALKELATLPNLYLWFSSDKETGKPPKVKDVRICYLQIEDTDIPKWAVDLVFRDQTTTVVKWVKSALVCPAENGITNTSCSKCQICYKRTPIPRKKKANEYSRNTTIRLRRNTVQNVSESV